ncbi:MAG TPA: hypothetical protein VI636_04465 [Candidatus Angelobacter sp.]
MFYQGERVRLVRAIPELALDRHAEGTITAVRCGEGGEPLAVEIRFAGSQRVTAEAPLDAVEPVIDSTGACTAVLWRLEKGGAALLEAAMHAMLNGGFELRQGLNVMQLAYDCSAGVWRKGERISDPTGAQAVVAGSTWDGCIVGVSGTQGFALEFRLRGRRQAYVMLHERWEAYEEQRCTTHPAMGLLRVLLNLSVAVGSECCAMPVASNWLIDEDWDSLLQQPYFPDLFIIPQSKLPQPLPPFYRAQPLVNAKAILTTLPVKFSPTDDSIERTPRELKLNQLRACKAIGEKAYDQMYESRGSLSGLYSDAKEAFYDAISIANELGLKEESEALERRLEHIKAVFRSQFS